MTTVPFTCRECGRSIISIGNQWLQEQHGDLCALCWSIPRWWEDPEMAKTLDPDHDRNPRNRTPQ